MYIKPSYLSVLKLQNYSSQCSNCAFFRKIRKMFWIIEKINEASVTNSFMNLSYTLHVIANGKALFSILYSFENIQIKYCWGQAVCYFKLAKTSVSRGLNL